MGSIGSNLERTRCLRMTASRAANPHAQGPTCQPFELWPVRTTIREFPAIAHINSSEPRPNPARILLVAARYSHPCVAFLPCRASGSKTSIRALPKRNQEVRRPYSRPAFRPETPPKAGCGTNRCQRSHDYELGTQRIHPGYPIHSGHHSLPRVRPGATTHFSP
jgi:hypothetical protein